MDISLSDLIAECDRFLASYPWVWSVEQQYGLPRGLLLAVGSRETNLTNEVGDGGHGHGVWQLDDRYHTIPAGFDSNIYAQATTAAGMLRDDIAALGGNLDLGVDAYNEGVGGAKASGDYGTTGHDYGPDVLGRMAAIQQHYPSAPAAPPHIVAEVTVPTANWIEVDGQSLAADGSGWTRLAGADPNKVLGVRVLVQDPAGGAALIRMPRVNGWAADAQGTVVEWIDGSPYAHFGCQFLVSQ